MGFLEIFLFSRESLHNFSTNPIYVSKWQGEQTALGFSELEDCKSLHIFRISKKTCKKYVRDEQGYVEENMNKIRLLVNQEHVHIKNVFKSKLENHSIIIALKHPTAGIKPRLGKAEKQLVNWMTVLSNLSKYRRRYKEIQIMKIVEKRFLKI